MFVESISGKTLEQYFRVHILGPLKMQDTSYNLADDKVLFLCTGSQGQPMAALSRLASRSPSCNCTALFTGRLTCS